MAVLLVLAVPVAVGAQELPLGEPGVTVVVPVVRDLIVIDGDLSDWSSIPLITTTSGPIPPTDPSNTGEVAWRVAATSQTLAFSATVVDGTIIAGAHGDDYWNEDSIEFYVNLSGDDAAASYGPGIAQITVSPVDLGNTDPSELTISGNNSAGLDVSGFVFATADGWGVEIALGLDGLTVPTDGESFGLQMQANGSSGGDRDTKLSWSVADVDDTSFTDPSVFGTGVFFDASIDDEEAVVTQGADDPGDTEVAQPVVPDLDVDVDDSADLSTAGEAIEPTDAEPEGSRSLLIAAVISAVTIVVGALWFEWRRKAYEARSASLPAYAELEILGDDGDVDDADR